MSIYDTIKAEAGPAPAYPSHGDFITYYGYAMGKLLGTFSSVGEAKTAGANTTEKNIDEAGYKVARDIYDKYDSKIADEWYARVRAEYPEINDAVFGLINSMAYENGHSSGYGEVELYIDKYADFAKSIMAAM